MHSRVDTQQAAHARRVLREVSMAYLLWLAMLAPDMSRAAVLPIVPAIHHPAEPRTNRRGRRSEAKLNRP